MGDHSEPFLLFEVVAHEILVSAQGPLVLGFGFGALGFGAWGLDNKTLG